MPAARVGQQTRVGKGHPLQLTIIGAGAIGGTIGAHMLRAGHEILFCDSDVEHVNAINSHGLTIEGPVVNFTVPARAVTPQDLPAQLHHVAIAVKSQHTASAAELLRGRLAADGYVVSFQNGLNNEVLVAVVGEDSVILSFVNFGADLIAPGRIMQGNIGTFRVGELPGRGITPRVRELVAALPYAQATDNILGYLWGKEAYGAMLFAGAVSDLSIADSLEQPEWRPLMLAVAREVLAQAPVTPEGFDGFEPGDLEGSLPRLAEFNRQSAKSHSGIYRDLVVRHRPTEVDGQLGALRGPLTQHTTALIHAIERGERSCEVPNLKLLAALERAERVGRPLQAVVRLVSAPRRAPGGPLLGHPVAVKDIFSVAGLPRGNGNPSAMAGPAEAEDAAVVAQLRTLGADVFCTTAMLEYAAGATHPQVPETLNPYDLTRTAGGSSGGSAAVVAAGVCDLALGTDTGGSVRIPASYCGVVGLKPSHLALSSTGVQPLAPSLDDVGILARDVPAAEFLFAALRPGPAAARKQRLRIGYFESGMAEVHLDPEVDAVVSGALRALANAGCDLVAIPAHPFRELGSLFDDIFLFEAGRVHAQRVLSDPAHYGPETLRLLRAAVGAEERVHGLALAARERLLPAAAAELGKVDVLLTPAVPFVAPATTPPVDTPEGRDEGAFTGVFNVIGAPALVLPGGWSEAGLPIGLQLVAGFGSDGQLLADAHLVERMLEVPRREPVPVSGADA